MLQTQPDFMNRLQRSTTAKTESSLAERWTINVGFEKVEGANKGNKYTGLAYSALDANGNRVGQPLKSSLFGTKYGIGALE